MDWCLEGEKGVREGFWDFLICIMMAGEGGMICWRMTSILNLGRVIYLVFILFAGRMACDGVGSLDVPRWLPFLT